MEVKMRMLDQCNRLSCIQRHRIGRTSQQDPKIRFRVDLSDENLIGSGMYGSVWRVMLHNQRFAVKTVQSLSAVMKEISLFSQQKPQRAVSILAHGRVKYDKKENKKYGKYAIVMPYVGVELGKFVERLDLLERHKFFVSFLLDGLSLPEYLKKESITHGDLRNPCNYCIHENRLILIDGSNVEIQAWKDSDTEKAVFSILFGLLRAFMPGKDAQEQVLLLTRMFHAGNKPQMREWMPGISDEAIAIVFDLWKQPQYAPGFIQKLKDVLEEWKFTQNEFPIQPTAEQFWTPFLSFNIPRVATHGSIVHFESSNALTTVIRLGEAVNASYRFAGTLDHFEGKVESAVALFSLVNEPSKVDMHDKSLKIEWKASKGGKYLILSRNAPSAPWKIQDTFEVESPPVRDPYMPILDPAYSHDDSEIEADAPDPPGRALPAAWSNQAVEQLSEEIQRRLRTTTDMPVFPPLLDPAQPPEVPNPLVREPLQPDAGVPVLPAILSTAGLTVCHPGQAQPWVLRHQSERNKLLPEARQLFLQMVEAVDHHPSTLCYAFSPNSVLNAAQNELFAKIMKLVGRGCSKSAVNKATSEQAKIGAILRFLLTTRITTYYFAQEQVGRITDDDGHTFVTIEPDPRSAANAKLKEKRRMIISVLSVELADFFIHMRK